MVHEMWPEPAVDRVQPAKRAEIDPRGEPPPTEVDVDDIETERPDTIPVLAYPGHDGHLIARVAGGLHDPCPIQTQPPVLGDHERKSVAHGIGRMT